MLIAGFTSQMFSGELTKIYSFIHMGIKFAFEQKQSSRVTSHDVKHGNKQSWMHLLNLNFFQKFWFSLKHTKLILNINQNID